MRSIYGFLFKVGCLSPFLALTACPQLSQKESVQYGAESNKVEIGNSIQSALQGTSPFSMKAGEFVHFIMTQSYLTASGPQTVIQKEEGITVVSVKESATTATFGLVKQTVTYDSDNKATRTEVEDQVIYKKTPSFSAPSVGSMSLNLLFSESFEGPLSLLASETPTDPNTVSTITYHNYTKKEFISPPPAQVVKQDNCGGIPNCEIHVTELEYDEVYWYQNGSTKRLRHKLQLSKDVPYQATILNQCVTATGKVGSQFILVEQCQPVVNFKFGH